MEIIQKRWLPERGKWLVKFISHGVIQEALGTSLILTVALANRMHEAEK